MRQNLSMNARPARRVALAALLLAAVAAPVRAQTSPPPPPPVSSQGTTPAAATPTQTDGQTQTQPGIIVDLARIKKALAANLDVRLTQARPRYRVVVLEPFPTFAERYGKTDLLHGPVKGTAMTHQEFVQMVTPNYMNSSAGITPVETLQAAFVNWAAQKALKKAFEAYTNARTEGQLRAIRAQIDRELAALRGGGG